MRTDEDDVRAALRSFDAEAPPAPAERADLAVRRAGGIRRRRAAAVALALVLPAVAVGVRVVQPEPKPDYTSVADWPDRGEPGTEDLRQVALAEWTDGRPMPPEQTVRWLWSGHVPNTSYDGVAFATCEADRCTRAVLSFAPEQSSRTPDGDPEVSAWRPWVFDLEPGRPMAPLSHYLEGFPDMGKNPPTVLFVLPAPDAASVTYTSPQRAGRGGAAGELERYGAVFAGGVGYLAADVTFTVRDADGDLLHEGLVGHEHNVGRAEQLTGIDLPPGYSRLSLESGQVGRAGPTGHRYEPIAKDPLALFVRCAGSGPVTVTYNGANEVVPCDGAGRQMDPRPAVEGAFEWLILSDDPYTVYVVALAKPPR